MTRAILQTSLSSRKLSRLARYVRSPDSGALGQGLRFAIAGGTVAVIYLSVTTVLANVFGVPFQLALGIALAAALVVHFLFQRFFVWIHHEEFSLPVRDQVGRYALVAGTQYGTTAIATSFLPSALNISTTIVYFAWTICVSAVNFVVFGRGVFHERSTEVDSG